MTLVTRRIRRLVIAAATVSAVTALAACGGSSSPKTGSGTASTGTAGPTDKVLHLSFLQDPGQPPDPDVFYAAQGLLLTTNIYEGLLSYKTGTATPTLQPALATSWKASSDNKVFTFQLRKGVVFHDGTPFTADAVKASFDRRLKVNQGPAYMVTGITSVKATGTDLVTVTLKDSNSAFLTYMASAYGPKMMSPTGLKANAGKDNDQTYLTTHDLGTGPYILSDAKVGSHYAMKSFDKYWGTKPYFTSVDIPVVTDSSSQQLQFNSGALAAILHDLPSSAVASYLTNKKFSNYSLPAQISDYLYLNPGKGLFADKSIRQAMLKAIDLDAVVKQAYFGRGTKGKQVYPANMVSTQYATQTIAYDPSALTTALASKSAAEKSITIGYDSSSPDNQLVATQLSAKLAASGLQAKVQSYPTSQIFGWISDPKNAPDMLATLGWPDAPSPYTWGHISWDKDAGLNYLHCSDDTTTKALAAGLQSGSATDWDAAAKAAQETGCWLNMVDVSDFMVTQTWLKGVENAHTVANPNTLILANLSA